MDKDTFKQLLSQGETKARPHGKANWTKILKQLQKDKGVHPTREIWEDYVKKVVNRLRCKEWLHKQAEEGKCVRVYKYGQYFWCFDPEVVAKVNKK